MTKIMEFRSSRVGTSLRIYDDNDYTMKMALHSNESYFYLVNMMWAEG